MTRRISLLAVAACALVAAPAASAHPGKRSFERTYPHASRLCAQVAGGHAPKRLAGSTAAVVSACTLLRTSFTSAQNGYVTTTAPLEQQATDALKTLRVTCRQARANGDRATCRQARRDTRATLRTLRGQVRSAAVTYHGAVDGARKTFWTTIRSLRGGSAITPDSAVGPAPTTPLPSESAVTDGA
jgi:hypothetical protein